MAERQYMADEEEEDIAYDISFSNVSVNKCPFMQEYDEAFRPIFPYEARLRNITYSTDIFAEAHLEKVWLEPRDKDETVQYFERKVVRSESLVGPTKINLGKCPIMIRSQLCSLSQVSSTSTVKDTKDCMYDQGGYFIINGSEKVIVAQERMANNIVLVFHKTQPHKFDWVAEIRSQAEGSLIAPQQVIVGLKAKQKQKTL